MKKIVLIGALVVGLQAAHAQITWIPKAGVTLSKVWGDDNSDGEMTRDSNGNTSYIFVPETADRKNKFGFTAGVAVNIPIGTALSLQPELNFIQKGMSSTVRHGDDYYMFFVGIGPSKGDYLESKYALTLNYLELPVLAKYTFNIHESKTRFFLEAGPSLALGLGGKWKWTATRLSQGHKTETTSDSKVKFGSSDAVPDGENYKYPVERRTDVGLQLGAGALIANKILVDVRYTFGLTKLYDVEIASRNRVLQFTVGVPLTLKK